MDTQQSIIAPGASLEKLAGGFTFTEGASCSPSGELFFTDQPNDRILTWSEGEGSSLFLHPSGRSNGTCFDPDGNLWTCADERNELWRISPDKKTEAVVTGYQGRLLNGPNDVWVRFDGGLYITDPMYPRDYWSRGPTQQPCEGVYYLPPGERELVLVEADLVKPNGIVGTPDGKTLYVSDIRSGKTWAYDIEPGGTLIGKRMHCELGSDGMTIDDHGNIYLTGHGVTVFDADGGQIAHVDVPEKWCGNICFGGPERNLLFITASEGIYGLRMNVRGVPIGG